MVSIWPAQARSWAETAAPLNAEAPWARLERENLAARVNTAASGNRPEDRRARRASAGPRQPGTRQVCVLHPFTANYASCHSLQCLPRSPGLELPRPARAPPGGRGASKPTGFSDQRLKEVARPQQRVWSSYSETWGAADAPRTPGHAISCFPPAAASAPPSSGAVTARCPTRPPGRPALQNDDVAQSGDACLLTLSQGAAERPHPSPGPTPPPGLRPPPAGAAPCPQK